MKTLPSTFYAWPHLANTTMDKGDLQELLLAADGWVLSCGRIWDIKVEHLGADIFKVTLENRWRKKCAASSCG